MIRNLLRMCFYLIYDCELFHIYFMGKTKNKGKIEILIKINETFKSLLNRK